VKIVDANVLLSAVNTGQRQHESANRWLLAALSGAEPVGLPWISLLAFVRVATNPRAFTRPLSVTDALEAVERWLSSPAAVVVEPSHRHFHMLSQLLTAVGTAGNLTSDAHLAVLALEHHAEVVSFDRDFERFDVKVIVPA
jgi:uncharacterized protein